MYMFSERWECWQQALDSTRYLDVNQSCAHRADWINQLSGHQNAVTQRPTFLQSEGEDYKEKNFQVIFFYLIVGQNYLFFFQKGWSSVSCARRWNKLSNFALLVQQPFPSKHCKDCGQFPDLQTCNQTCNNTSLRWKILSLSLVEIYSPLTVNFVNCNSVHSKIEKWRFFVCF